MKIITPEKLESFKTKSDLLNSVRFVSMPRQDDKTLVIGTKKNTKGLSFEIPWIEVNENGLIVDFGYHTHSVFANDDNGNMIIE